MHVWSITPDIHAMSAHVLVKGPDIKRLDAVRKTIEDMLQKDYDINHTTLQMECRGCGDGEAGMPALRETGARASRYR